MTDFPLRSARSISPWMLMVSAILHGVALAALIHMYASSRTKPITIRGDVTHVKLVESQQTEPATQKASQGPTRESHIPPPPEIEPMQPPLPEPAKPREAIHRASVTTVPEKEIKLKKRKKPPQRVEQAEPKPKKKPEDEAGKKPKQKETPEEILRKRLAEIRQDVDQKRAARPPTPPADASGAMSDQAAAQGPATGIVDHELLRWFDMVRRRINENWSMLGHDPGPGKVTIIGIQITDDGRLVAASVDQSSGDTVFDRSAMRAVRQAAPFPRISAEISEKIRTAGGLALRFTPRGLQ
ncbi:MAG: TonB family protein [Deltaproteobacteria bacterium]|nr:TonB family protein [Deltaproteobacteria bacterium]